MLRHQYDNDKQIARLLSKNPKALITITHGRKDATIPFEMGEKLASKFPDQIHFHEFPKAGHNNIFDSSRDLIMKFDSSRDLIMKTIASSYKPSI